MFPAPTINWSGVLRYAPASPRKQQNRWRQLLVPWKINGLYSDRHGKQMPNDKK